VYVIGSRASHAVKIGRSEDVARRLAEIQRMSPVELEVLWQRQAGGDLETALHRRFRALRTHGEWFDFGADDPVEVVGMAAAEEAERLKEAAQAKARWDPWEQTEVFLMNGAPMVMPPRSQGGWQCVAWDEGRDRRCRRMMSATRSHCNVEWVVPGLGWLQGHSLDGLRLVPQDGVPVARAIQRALMQVCDLHEDSQESKREPVAWRRFDLSRDRGLIRPFTPGPGEFDLLPGLEEMDARVRAFAESLVSDTRKRRKRARSGGAAPVPPLSTRADAVPSP
jgi:hypothetical protein